VQTNSHVTVRSAVVCHWQYVFSWHLIVQI